MEEKSNSGRQRSRSAEHFCEIKASQQSLLNFLDLNEETNFIFIEPMVETLQRLESKAVTVQVLQETKIGRTIQRLFKHCNDIKQHYSQNREVYSQKYDRLKGLALQILCKWRFLVEKHLFQGQHINEKLLLKSHQRQPEVRVMPSVSPSSLENPKIQARTPLPNRSEPSQQQVVNQSQRSLSPGSWQKSDGNTLGTDCIQDRQARCSLFRKRNNSGLQQMKAPPPLIGANVSFAQRFDSYYK